MARVLVFDVNETLLDLKTLDPHFERIFGDRTVRGLWFNQFIQSALVTIVTDTYTPFGQIGMAALDMVAARRDIIVKAEDKQGIAQTLSHLPPHADARAGDRAAGTDGAPLPRGSHPLANAPHRGAARRG